jgi:8-oxo-dGTP diphosphatase
LPPEQVEVAAAIIRFGGDLLMVRQGALGEELFWSVPAGRLEPGELVTEALVREVKEETGITVLDPGPIAFTAQVDDRREGWFATVWTFDVAAWEGAIEVADPDGLVAEAAWIPVEEACRRLDLISWQPLTARYLRGMLEARPLWLRRVHPDGREEWF